MILIISFIILIKTPHQGFHPC